MPKLFLGCHGVTVCQEGSDDQQYQKLFVGQERFPNFLLSKEFLIDYVMLINA